MTFCIPRHLALVERLQARYLALNNIGEAQRLKKITKLCRREGFPGGKYHEEMEIVTEFICIDVLAA